MRVPALLALCLLAAVAPAGATAVPHATHTPAASNTSHPTVRIHAVYPNPTLAGDVGEFVVLDVTRPTNLGAYALTDGESTTALPNGTVSGRVVVSAAPNRTRELTDSRVRSVPSTPSLSNAGETVRLSRNGTAVDALSYPRAPEGRLFVNGSWRVPGRTHRQPLVVSDVNTTAFVLPDDPGVPRAFLASATDTLLLAGYTFTSKRDERALRRLRERGVDVHVLLEGHPIGGIPAREARVLARLERDGIRVSVLGGPHDPYAYHHAKYAVADGERVLVTTENWEPQSLGGRGHRGWGVVVHSPRLARELTRVFDADAGWLDAQPWRVARVNATVENATSGGTSHRYPRSFVSTRGRVTDATLLVTPDDAGSGLVRLLDSANESIRLEQMSVSNGTLLTHVVAASRRGVSVRILLSGAWYARRENAATVQRLNALAARDDLSLHAKLVHPHGRFDVVHAKGLVVDDERVLVGSLNWNPQARTENREAMIVLHDSTVAAYYARVFDADWRGGSNRLPWSLAVVTLLAALGTAAWLRREIAFEETAGRA